MEGTVTDMPLSSPIKFTQIYDLSFVSQSFNQLFGFNSGCLLYIVDAKIIIKYGINQANLYADINARILISDLGF